MRHASPNTAAFHSYLDAYLKNGTKATLCSDMIFDKKLNPKRATYEGRASDVIKEVAEEEMMNEALMFLAMLFSPISTDGHECLVSIATPVGCTSTNS
jgi:hypothetical protein